MAEDIKSIKEEYRLQKEKNDKIVKILKRIVYVLASLLLINFVSMFIFKMMEKSFWYYDVLAVPLGLILFGAIAILLTQINPRISKSNDTKGDKLIFIIGIIICLGGLVYLILNLVS